MIGQLRLLQQLFQSGGQLIVLSLPLKVIALLRIADRSRAEKRPPEEGFPAAQPGQRMAGDRTPEMCLPLLIGLNHMEGGKQRRCVVPAQGQDAGPPPAQLRRLNEMQGWTHVQPPFEQYKQAPGCPGVVQTIADGKTAAPAKAQMPGRLGESRNLTEHAAGFPQGQPHQLFLHPGGEALPFLPAHQESSSTAAVQRACSSSRSR